MRSRLSSGFHGPSTSTHNPTFQPLLGFNLPELGDISENAATPPSIVYIRRSAATKPVGEPAHKVFRNFDIIVATFVLTAGTVTTGFSYLKIREIEHPRNVLFEGALPSGKSTTVISNEHGCVGHFTTQISKAKGVLIETNGMLRLRTGDRELSVSIGARASFNPLGQMMDGLVKLSSDQVRLLIEAKNVNPIELNLSAHVGTEKHVFSTSSRGPLILEEFEPGRYRLEHNNPMVIRPELTRLSSGVLQNEMRLSFDTYTGNPPGCRETWLNLNPLINRVESFMDSPSLQQFSELLGGIDHD